jgi:hypothetical protein
VTTRYYGCGGHVTKGKKVCKMNPIPLDDLETMVIDTILKFYSPYLANGGRRKLAEAVKQQIGSEGVEFDEAHARAKDEEQAVAKTINNLLDNITPTNREFVDRRLEELTEQRRQLATRLDELDLLASSQAEVKAIVADTMQFLGGLEFTLREGVPQEKLVALRQCIERIHINKPADEVKIRVRTVPGGTLQGDETITLGLDAACPKQASV